MSEPIIFTGRGGDYCRLCISYWETMFRSKEVAMCLKTIDGDRTDRCNRYMGHAGPCTACAAHSHPCIVSATNQEPTN